MQGKNRCGVRVKKNCFYEKIYDNMLSLKNFILYMEVKNAS